MTTKTTELKAALPADFSGKSSDAPRWSKAMKAYFAINPTLYTSDNDKIMTMLNKMSEGRGASFAEMWYDKMADSAVSSSQKTFDKFTKDFKETFFPFDTKATAHLELSKLTQRSFKREEGTNSDGSKRYLKDDGFQRYITDFQNVASKTGITDESTLVE